MQGSATQGSAVDQPLVIPTAIRERKRRRRWILLALGVVAAAAILIAVLAPLKVEPVQFRTALVERRTITRVVEATGQVDVVQRVEVPAPAAGRILEILVRTGDRVSERQPLARLDERAAVIAVRGAQAGTRAAASRVTEAEVALAAAADARARTEKLLERSLASPSELSAARSAEARARAALAAARAESAAAVQNLKSAELGESFATVLSPIEGVVLRAPDSPGAATAPEQGPLFVVGSALETLRIDAEVAESEIGLLKPGQVARFSVPAFAGRSFDARVEHLGIDAQRTGIAVRYPVELRAPNADRALLPGMTATIRVEVARVENALATREAALRFRPEDDQEAEPRSRVYRVDGSELEPVDVIAGLSDGAYTEIRPKRPELLSVGSPVALGTLASSQQKRSGAGIRLGNK